MTDTNVVTVVGRLTKDAEMKQNTGGLPVGFFTIATNRKKKDGGNYVEEASFLDVSVLGNYAETIIPRLKKGTQACIVGELKQERWKDRVTSQNKTRVVIIANSIQITGGRNV